MKYVGKTNEYFEIIKVDQANAKVMEKSALGELSFLWFQSDGNQLKIDKVSYVFNANDIVCLTDFNTIEVVLLHEAKVLKWNKHFYCIINHDSEVGCRGILFYGATMLPVIRPSGNDLETFSTVWKMLELEMQSNDSLQGEMLQMMLKRILILSTRMYKEQTNLGKVKTEGIEIIREYHFLVEQHFKQKHTVAEYADLLNRSPKTLSNLFRKLGRKTPLQFIKDRRMLEARRLLVYTSKTISEVGYELGFADVQSFSRFFKKEEGISPNEYQRINI